MSIDHYQRDVADTVCELVAQGITVTRACQMMDVSYLLFCDWAYVANKEGLAQKIKNAIELGCDALAYQCIAIADTPFAMDEITFAPDGTTTVRKDAIAHRKLQIETRMKLLPLWSRKYARERDNEARMVASFRMLRSDEAL